MAPLMNKNNSNELGVTVLLPTKSGFHVQVQEFQLISYNGLWIFIGLCLKVKHVEFKLIDHHLRKYTLRAGKIQADNVKYLFNCN